MAWPWEIRQVPTQTGYFPCLTVTCYCGARFDANWWPTHAEPLHCWNCDTPFVFQHALAR